MPRTAPALAAAAALLIAVGCEQVPAPSAGTSATEQDVGAIQETASTPVDDSPETRRKINDLKLYIDKNALQAEAKFKRYVAANAGKVIPYGDQFVRVVSFSDIALEDSEYKIMVHYVYCNPDIICRKLDTVDQFEARFESGELTFLRKL